MSAPAGETPVAIEAPASLAGTTSATVAIEAPASLAGTTSAEPGSLEHDMEVAFAGANVSGETPGASVMSLLTQVKAMPKPQPVLEKRLEPKKRAGGGGGRGSGRG